VQGAIQDPPHLHKQTGAKGFTLVELIVVIVILGILLAIAVPALTGYIAKAQDKEWEARAHDAQQAFRSLLSEDLGNGTLGKGVPTTGAYSTYLTEGESSWATTKLKYFHVTTLSVFASGYSLPGAVPDSAQLMYINQAAELMGLTPITTSATPGLFGVAFFAPRPSDYTISDAPAFIYRYYPEGGQVGNPMVCVTFGISGLTAGYDTYSDLENDIKANGTVDPDVGYRVYHVIR
jgi:prepilin-type N-terminal cleavage/methylation domain-containing protein